MRSLILVAPGQIELRDVPIPSPGPGEVRVRVGAATTCGTDLKAYRRGHPQIPMPGPFGHEYSGVVEAVGEGARFELGDAVMGVHSAPCQHCFWCRRAQENLCESIMSSKVLGSYSESLLIPERIARLNLFHKPPELDFAQAALLEPVACVAQGIAEIPHFDRVKSVLVVGPGAIGLIFVAALFNLGVSQVHLAGRNPARLAVGESLGATITPWDAAVPFEGRGYDVVIECTGQVDVWERSVDLVRRGGSVMFFGGPPGGTCVTLATHRLHYDQITLLSPFHFGTAAVRTAYKWLLDPNFDLSQLVTAERKLEEATETFADLEAGRGIKYAFIP